MSVTVAVRDQLVTLMKGLDREHKMKNSCGAHCEHHKKNETQAPPPAGADVIYTCPMHPEIRQEGPGNCPICGMALEPETITGEEGENPELADMRKRFWIGLVLTLPVFVLEMGVHLLSCIIISVAHFPTGSSLFWLRP